MRVKSFIWRLLGFGVAGILLMVLLFVTSEQEMHHNNAFIRRYPHHPIKKLFDFNLGYNSYYLAGFENDRLYLGNHTAPLHLLEVNLKTKDTTHIKIGLESKDIPFQSITVNVVPPYFFVMDGTVPCILRGYTRDWEARDWMKGEVYFTNAKAVDSVSIFIKTISSSNRQAILGLLQYSNGFNTYLYPELLEKQMDGIFDVDGLLTMSPDFKSLGYSYYYRNEFMILDADLKSIQRMKTIDTVSMAQITLSKISKTGEVKMTSPPLIINRTAAQFDAFMLIHSNRLGKYEQSEMLEDAFIIDVYNWEKERYEFSFYLYHFDTGKLKELKVFESYLVALSGEKLSVNQIKSSVFK
ncbi:hypothetical protein [Formosa sp. A9]|uniref:hypothetical protein n=1 Tax=Formosa sp. A9 TaxID=3442641 RepID=UPI003EBD059E